MSSTFRSLTTLCGGVPEPYLSCCPDRLNKPAPTGKCTTPYCGANCKNEAIETLEANSRIFIGGIPRSLTSEELRTEPQAPAPTPSVVFFPFQ